MKVRDKKESLKPGREHPQGELLDFLPLKTILILTEWLYEVNGVISHVERVIEKWGLFFFSECSACYYFTPNVNCVEK